jgi:hypothetical protein
MFLGILLAVVSGAVGVALVAGQVNLRARSRALLDGAVAEGTVTGVASYTVGSRTNNEGMVVDQGVAVKNLLITFTDVSGAKVTYKEKFKGAEGVTQGTYYPVHYNPKNPEGTATIVTRSLIERKRTDNAKACALSGAVFVVGVLMIVGVIPT